MYKSVECEIGGQPLVIETGRVAKQASGSVVVRYGDTMVLVSVVSTDEVRQGIDFFPLTVDYQEFSWAAGRIPGNFFRREIGRPSLKETLTCRVIDRPIRPRFPKGYKYETQVIANVISSDTENDADVLALNGASAALCVSDIPWDGPIGGCRVGRVDGEWLINPTKTELESSDIDIMVAASRDAIVMVEGGAEYASEAEVLEAIWRGHEACQPLIDAQEELMRDAGKAKRGFTAPEPDTELADAVRKAAWERVGEASVIADKMERYGTFKQIKKSVIEELSEEYPDRAKEIGGLISDLKSEFVRTMIVDQGKRIDGRGLTDVRPITCDVGVLPRAHGSALFTRGETQALVTTTLGTAGDEQRVESIMGDSLKHFFLHYNFPPFSVGETKRLGGPSRRDLGHGALAERALKYSLPDHEDFQYTIRIVSDILESNGSSSMATVCGGSLSMMDAAVPTGAAVAGVAMGLIKEGEKVAVLTDILGDEDHLGDMDFKVAGSEEGITAIQMDIKISEVDKETMSTALAQAKEGRLHIIGKMNDAILKPRQSMSDYAPQIIAIQIRQEKIRDIIGPGGKVIKAIQAETGCRVDVEDSGRVLVSGNDREALDQAIEVIKSITREAEVGQIYEGTVRRITDFGAFIEILPGTDGLCHISELEHYRVNKVTDVLSEGDTVKVKCIGIDPNGKVKLSRKALIEPSEEDKKRNQRRRPPRER